MPRTRPKKDKSEYHTYIWHYEDPTFGGPYCKYPGYGDFYSADRWPVTQNKKEVTCMKCLDRLTKGE